MLQGLQGYEKPEVYDLRSGGVWNVYFRVRGVREFYDTVRHAPFVQRPLTRQVYGNWEFEVRDPNGYILVFSEQA